MYVNQILFFLAFVNQTWNIRAQTKHSTKISIQWPRFVVNDPRLSVTKYIALCTSKTDPRNISSAITDAKGTSVTVVNLMPNTNYIVQVLAFLSSSSSSSKGNESIRASREVVVTTKPQGKLFCLEVMEAIVY